MSTTWAETCRRVIEQARGRCGYCRMHQALQGATFHIEHIVLRSADGGDTFENFCLACPSCNLHKSDAMAGIDPRTGAPAPWFHPRKQRWAVHFEWHGPIAVGITGIGRATVEALKLNGERRRRIREAEALFGLFPPTD